MTDGCVSKRRKKICPDLSHNDNNNNGMRQNIVLSGNIVKNIECFNSTKRCYSHTCAFKVIRCGGAVKKVLKIAKHPKTSVKSIGEKVHHIAS